MWLLDSYSWDFSDSPVVVLTFLVILVIPKCFWDCMLSILCFILFYFYLIFILCFFSSNCHNGLFYILYLSKMFKKLVSLVVKIIILILIIYQLLPTINETAWNYSLVLYEQYKVLRRRLGNLLDTAKNTFLNTKIRDDKDLKTL